MRATQLWGKRHNVGNNEYFAPEQGARISERGSLQVAKWLSEEMRATQLWGQKTALLRLTVP